jgi:CHASE2 domain-containing sensor protein
VTAVSPRSATRAHGVAVVAGVVVLAALFRPVLSGLLDRPAVANWATVFVAITLQAVPFLVFGVTISAAIAA